MAQMDTNLAALKLLSVQLSGARQTSAKNTSTFAGILFQRAWVQGVLVSRLSSVKTPSGDDIERFLLDDGTGIIELVVCPGPISNLCEIGRYVMVVGGFLARPTQLPLIKVHKLVDLSAYPDREAMWYLEVMEAFKLFYNPQC